MKTQGGTDVKVGPASLTNLPHRITAHQRCMRESGGRARFKPSQRSSCISNSQVIHPTPGCSSSQPRPHRRTHPPTATCSSKSAGAAASTIWKRFVALVLRANGLDDAPREGGTEEGMMERFVPVVTPEAVMGLGEEKMRGVGLSQRKTSYIQDLARSFKEGTFDDISDMSDEEQRYVHSCTQKVES